MVFVCEEGVLLLQQTNLLIESGFLSLELQLLALQLFLHLLHLQFLNAIDLLLLVAELLLKLQSQSLHLLLVLPNGLLEAIASLPTQLQLF